MTNVDNPLQPKSVTFGESHPGQHGTHPTDVFYVRIAIILAVLTAVEVGLSYIGIAGLALVLPLLFVMAVKFAMVGMYFMHLRFDNRVLNRIFYSGLFLAVSVYAAALMAFHFFRY